MTDYVPRTYGDFVRRALSPELIASGRGSGIHDWDVYRAVRDANTRSARSARDDYDHWATWGAAR